MSGAVRSGCVVVEAMQTADKYLRVLIFALLMKQLDFELYTKHLDGDGRAVQPFRRFVLTAFSLVSPASHRL
jgi:hypothetical protein